MTSFPRRCDFEASFPCPGLAGHRPYTPAMRRWVCVAALLFGFSGDGYAFTMRARIPVPIERPLPASPRGRGFVPTLDWWRR